MIMKATHDPDMDDLLYALNYSAKHSKQGISGLANFTTYTEQSLRNRLNPNDDSHRMSLDDFVMVVKLTGDVNPLDILCRMFGGQFISRTAVSGDSIMKAMLKAMSEHGDIAKALDASMADGKLDAAEVSMLYREIREARNSLIELENTLRSQVQP